MPRIVPLEMVLKQEGWRPGPHPQGWWVRRTSEQTKTQPVTYLRSEQSAMGRGGGGTSFAWGCGGSFLREQHVPDVEICSRSCGTGARPESRGRTQG